MMRQRYRPITTSIVIAIIFCLGCSDESGESIIKNNSAGPNSAFADGFLQSVVTWVEQHTR